MVAHHRHFNSLGGLLRRPMSHTKPTNAAVNLTHRSQCTSHPSGMQHTFVESPRLKTMISQNFALQQHAISICQGRENRNGAQPISRDGLWSGHWGVRNWREIVSQLVVLAGTSLSRITPTCLISDQPAQPPSVLHAVATAAANTGCCHCQ